MDSFIKKTEKTKRRNSLRLRHFDYSTPRAYFITICAKSGRAIFSRKKLAQKTIDFLRKRKEKNNYKIYAYCLMPDHLHILLNPADSNIPISKFLQTLKSQTGFWCKKEHGLPLWQRGFYDHIVRRNEDLVKIAQYILDNPIRKGLAEKAEEYPYSGSWDDIE